MYRSNIEKDIILEKKMAQVCSLLETTNHDAFVSLKPNLNTSFMVGGIDLSNPQLLGEGTYGKVYLGRERKTQAYAAVKIMETIKHEYLIECELEMMEYICKSGHPNIVQLIEHSEISGLVFISMEYCSGGRLFDFVNQDRCLLVDELKVISLQMAEALVFLSDNNIVHCDIKLQNILLSSAISDPERNYLWNHTLKLSDFGLSQYCESDKFIEGRCGTPGYTAPEVLSDIPYGKSADMFSMGVLLYVCATKQMPFVPTTDRDKMIKRIKRGTRMNVLMDVDALLGELVCYLMQLNPQERLTAVEFLNHDFNM